jgi:copper chaperone CopZ
MTLLVKGWTCASCAVATRVALSKLDGVTAVKTNAETNEALVTYDDAKVKPETMIQAIEKLGYSAVLKQAPSTPAHSRQAKTTLSLSGVYASASQRALEQQLLRTAGVLGYEVHGERGEADVSYDADATDAGTIAGSLLKHGVKVRLAPWEPVDAMFTGCSNGSCGTRIPNAQVVAQPGAKLGQKVYCPVSGVVLIVQTSTPTVDVGGKPIRVCCEGCARHFKAHREQVLALRGLELTS